MRSEYKTPVALGIGIAIAVIGISVAFSLFEPAQISEKDGKIVKDIDKSNLKKAPEIRGISHYLNTTPEKLKDQMKDKVILYDIWTYSCINCIRTLPYVTAWNEKYSDEGLLIIGIHSPEFEFEKNKENVKKAVKKHDIKYPVLMDNDWVMWDAFQNKYWPRKYIADHEGYIRYDHIGEGAYKETENVIQHLLKERSADLQLNIEAGKDVVNLDEFEHTRDRTPELYFGYELAHGRSQIGNDKGFSPDNIIDYKIPNEQKLHHFYLEGKWQNNKDNMELVSGEGKIRILYHAKEVNIVTAGSANLEIFLDGQSLPANYAGNDVINNEVKVSQPSLYNVISSSEASTHTLDIAVKNKGFQIYTFTFG